MPGRSRGAPLPRLERSRRRTPAMRSGPAATASARKRQRSWMHPRYRLHVRTVRERRRAPVVLSIEVTALPSEADLLDRDLELLVEHDRVRQVPPVEADQTVATADIGLTAADNKRRAGFRRCERPEAPRRVQVVLGASAADRRCALSVEVHLHLALAPPMLAVLHADAARPAEEAARSLQAIGDDEVTAQLGRVLTPECGVQDAGVVGDGTDEERHLVVEQRVPFGCVGVLDADAIMERHRDTTREPAVLVDGCE